MGNLRIFVIFFCSIELFNFVQLADERNFLDNNTASGSNSNSFTISTNNNHYCPLISYMTTSTTADILSPIRNILLNYKLMENITLNLNKSFNFGLTRNQTKRFIFSLIKDAPLLTIKLTGNRYPSINSFNHLLLHNDKVIRYNSKEISIPCAIKGNYDLIVWLKTRLQHRNRLKIELNDQHPYTNWPFLNRSTQITLRTKNRIQKKQIILKWSRSQLDGFAIQYCMLINPHGSIHNFCTGIEESHLQRVNSFHHHHQKLFNCNSESVWLKFRQRTKQIDATATNIICTGNRTQQILTGLIPNIKYYIDIFGIHTRLKNLPIHLKSSVVWFNRSHPIALKENNFNIQKLSGFSSISVFSFKVPARKTATYLRYLILPCGGSQIDVKILQKRNLLVVHSIHQPTYIRLDNVQSGDRYLTRIYPTNDDEIVKANKVGIAITTRNYFRNLPELPSNITVFEIKSTRTCNHTTIAWYASPERKNFRYCVIVLRMSWNSIDPTNYCTDFSKKILNHPLFQYVSCFDKSSRPIEDAQLLNLSPNSSYLIYVTINLTQQDNVRIKPLPYQSLKINFNVNQRNCQKDVYDDFAKEDEIISPSVNIVNVNWSN